MINSAPPLRIVGQGLAGTMLGWACEQRGIAFRVVDRGHADAASRVGAGLVSPLTGQRLVPTWKFAEWRARTWEIYTRLEQELGCPLVRQLRIRRLYRSEKERMTMQARLDRPEVAVWVDSADADGLWMHGAFQVDTAALIGAMRRRWLAKGWLVEAEVTKRDDQDCPTIWCVGAGVREQAVGVAEWELSKGELLSGHMIGIDEEVVLNDGQWILPLGGGRVRVGATFDRDDLSLEPSGAGGDVLRAAAQRLSEATLTDVTVDVGLRVNVPRRRPVVGWTDVGKRVGIFAGLAAKGALWAPVLAEQWVADDLDGGELEIEVRPEQPRRI